MQIKIDESVLRKTEVFSEVLEDANRRNGIAPDLACGIREEYGDPIPTEDKDAIDNLSGLGILFARRSRHKTSSLQNPGHNNRRVFGGNRERSCLLSGV